MTSSNDSDQALALALVQQGWSHLQLQRPQAAWAAWQRALRVVPDDPAAREALETLESAAELPAAARTVYRFQRPRDADRRARWDLAFRGRNLEQLDAAAAAFADLCAEDPTDAAAAYNEGLCLAWLGRNVEAIGALDRAVRLLAGDDFDRAVEAWTLAEVLRQGGGAEALADDLRYVWVIDGADRDVVTQLAGRVPLVPAATPRNPVIDQVRTDVEIFEWLDRPLPAGPAELKEAADLPRLLATVVGTSQVLRLSSPDPESLDEIQDLLIQVVGERAATLRREASPLPLTLLDAALWRFRFPDWLDREARQPLTRGAVESSYEDRWIHVPRKGLDGRSPLEAARLAAADVVVRARLTAVLRLREQLGARPGTAELYQGYPFDRLRRRLGLDPVDPATLDLEDVSCMSEAELDALDPAAPEDVRLADAFQSAAGLRQDDRTSRFAAELVRRNSPSLARLDLASLFAPLVRQAMSAQDPGRAIAWLDRARAIASGSGRRTFDIWNAEIFARTGDPEAALKTYEAVLERTPSDLALAFDAAGTLLDQGYEEYARPLLLHARDQARLAGDARAAERAQEILDEVLS
ncbi:MAG: hypothetical protein QOE66_3022 [Chloroflexota bacterium]|nr:hypothetical protein [Chloroflexota bacterium]